jgi:Haemolysin-III related
LSEIDLEESKKREHKRMTEMAVPHIGDRSEIVEETPEIVEEPVLKTFIGHLMFAPAFLKDNEYILRGYRIGFNTKKLILRSLFMLHNETVNVWTHLIGVLVFLVLLIWTASALYASATYKTLL